jgi:ubiquinone/menaquinone biosynthesis C-methylase UbiE
MRGNVDCVATEERRRILAEYRRREVQIDHDLYAPYQPAEMLMRFERKRVAAQELFKAGIFPRPGDQCVEIGYGTLGWLGDLISWGLRETDLHGIELDPDRAARAKQILPLADLRIGDATELPWDRNTFQLAIASTVFTSILNPHIRYMVAQEIIRVLKPGGGVLWYDFRFNNPANPHVRKVDRKELKDLFSGCKGKIRSITLAPPIARLVATKSWSLATVLGCVPFFRTHLLAVLVKES